VVFDCGCVCCVRVAVINCVVGALGDRVDVLHWVVFVLVFRYCEWDVVWVGIGDRSDVGVFYGAVCCCGFGGVVGALVGYWYGGCVRRYVVDCFDG